MFFAYASKLNLQPNIKVFITKVYHFTHHARRKIITIYKPGVKQFITNEYKGKFFSDYAKLNCFAQALKVKREMRYGFYE